MMLRESPPEYEESARVRYTRHARIRMEQRKITQEEVLQTIDSPDVSYADKAGNPIYVGHLGGRRIKVVVGKDTSPPVIITVGD